MNTENFAQQIALEVKQGFQQHDLQEVHDKIVVAAKCGETKAVVDTICPLGDELLSELQEQGISSQELGEEAKTGKTGYQFSFPFLVV